MSTELIQQKPGELAQVQTVTASVANQLMAVIAANPTAGGENIKALLDGVERVTKWQAEQEFTAAFARLKFPPIVKAKKNAGARSQYADYSDIQEIIDPILAAEGFTLTFSSGAATEQGVPTHGLLSHVGGHSRAGVIYLPIDKSGAMKDNALWGIGSSTSYGMRYCAKLMLNLRFIGEDNDGARNTVTPNEREQIDRAIQSSGADESKLLQTYGVKTIADLPRANFKGVQALINARVRKSLKDTDTPESEIEAELRKLWSPQ